MSNQFENANVTSWYTWIFKGKSSSKAIVIYFLSRRYGTSPRFFPLYNNCRETDIILFQGSRFPGIDRIYLRLLPFFIKFFRKKLSRYQNFIAFNSDPNLVIPTNMILNLDDPTYTTTELLEIIHWESKVIEFGFGPTIVCTTNYIRRYLSDNGIRSNIHVIPQGHSNLGSPSRYRDLGSDGVVNFVYISPTIDVKGDPSEGHNMWDASTLLLDIWPKVTAPNARLHLIGCLGQNASLCLSDSRIISYGLISIKDCSELLPKFDVALYPRVHDNAWLPQKLIEYIGAGLPILSFNLIDTSIVGDLNVGILVNTSGEFAQIMDEISTGLLTVNDFRKNSVRASSDFSWMSLAANFELTYL